MTLQEIASSMSITQRWLRAHVKPGGNGIESSTAIDTRRRFILKAFSLGHEPEAICEFIDRTPVMLLHALRMGCMERAGGDYGRTLKQLADELRRVAA